MTPRVPCGVCGRAAQLVPWHPARRYGSAWLELWRTGDLVCLGCALSNPDELLHCCHRAVERLRRAPRRRAA